MAATLVIGGIASALIVFGASIGSAIAGHVGFSGSPSCRMDGRALGGDGSSSRCCSPSTTTFGPNRESPSWQWVSPGGVGGDRIFLAASLGFSFYVAKFGRYSNTYGAFAGVVILIFWLYLAGLAILIGGEINAETEREAAANRPSRRTGQRPAGGDVPGPSTARKPLELAAAARSQRGSPISTLTAGQRLGMRSLPQIRGNFRSSS